MATIVESGNHRFWGLTNSASRRFFCFYFFSVRGTKAFFFRFRAGKFSSAAPTKESAGVVTAAILSPFSSSQERIVRYWKLDQFFESLRSRLARPASAVNYQIQPVSMSQDADTLIKISARKGSPVMLIGQCSRSLSGRARQKCAQQW